MMKKLFIFVIILFLLSVNIYSVNIGMSNPFIYDKIIHIGLLDSGVGYKFLKNRLEIGVGLNPLPFFLSSFGIKDFFSFTGNINFFINKSFSVYAGTHYASYSGEDYLKDTLNEELKEVIVIKDLQLNFKATEIYGGIQKKLSFIDIWGNLSYTSFKPEHDKEESSIRAGIGIRKNIKVISFYRIIPYLTASYDSLTKDFIVSLTVDNKFWDKAGLKVGLIYPGLKISVGEMVDIPVLPVFDLYIELLSF